MAGIPRRLLVDDEEAEKALNAPPAGDEAAKAEEARRKEEEARAAVAPAPSSPPPTPAPSAPNADTAALQAEVARLTRALDDENNPTWKQRYSSLQGMFNHQGEELKTLKADVAELKAKPTPPVTPEPPDTSEYDALVEEVGEKAAKIIMARDAKSKKQLDEALSTVNGEIAATKGEAKTAADRAAELEKSQQMVTQERFFNELTARVPEWKQLNGWDGIPQNPKFTEFLQQRLPGSNLTYNDLLNDHHSKGDVQRVAEIFELGKKHAGALSVINTDGSEPPLEPGKGAGAGAPPPKPATPKTYTKAEHDRLMREITLPGRFKGTEAERQRLEDDLIAAELEGRVK